MPQRRRGYRKPTEQENEQSGSPSSGEQPQTPPAQTPPAEGINRPRGNRRPGRRPPRNSSRPRNPAAPGDPSNAVSKPSPSRTFSPEDSPPQEHGSRQPNRPAKKRPASSGNLYPKEITGPPPNRPPRRQPPSQEDGSPQDTFTPRPNRSNRPAQRRSAPRTENNADQGESSSPQNSRSRGNMDSRGNTYSRTNSNTRGNSYSRGNSNTRENANSRGNSYSRGRSSQPNRFIDRPAPTVPIRTNKGIKARSQRGQFSQYWWARRWIEAMESIVDPARLQRGRSYARTGQVLSIDETKNGIKARVQGSRPQPYDVTIQVTPLTDDQWNQVIDALSEQALFTAQLLAGEMPSNIEDAFNASGVSLFPRETGDLTSSCSCPDWANPCKHVAATHYILGDHFDDDPFLLFRMRGRSQEQILEALRQRRSESGEVETELDEEPEVETDQTAPLEDSLDHFWEPVESLDSFPLTMRLATVDMPLLQRLGEPAFMGGQSLQALLKPVYDIVTRSALLAAYRDEEPTESSSGQE